MVAREIEGAVRRSLVAGAPVAVLGDPLGDESRVEATLGDSLGLAGVGPRRAAGDASDEPRASGVWPVEALAEGHVSVDGYDAYG